MCFLWNRSSYSFETSTIVIITPENLRVNWVWYSKYKEKWCFSPKCVFLRNRSSYSLETCTIAIGMAENLRVHWVWPSKYKEKWCFIPKCGFFSEMDHHTALKLVPLWSSYLKTSVWYSKYKESDVLGQNVFPQKQIIIQLWNLYHCDHHTSKPQGALSLALSQIRNRSSKQSDENFRVSLALQRKCFFFQKWIIIQL